MSTQMAAAKGTRAGGGRWQLTGIAAQSDRHRRISNYWMAAHLFFICNYFYFFLFLLLTFL
jgi:hypothetical protein